LVVGTGSGAGTLAAMPVSGWQQGRVRVVVIDRPDRANAIDLETAEALAATFDELERDDDTWAVVLTGAGKRVFSAGMDLKAVRAGQADQINGVAGGFAGLVHRDFPKPVVAAVNGAAMGGGFEIVLACDLVVAAEHARFGLPEVTQGLMAASGGAVRLPQRLPWPPAMELLLLGDPIDAQRALELQLVNRLVPGPEVVPAAVELAERLGANGPLAVQASKRVARTTLADGEAAGWRLNAELAPAVTGSEDAAEAARAASEKRDPVWSGR
jgi:enoyl-CoA hydratase/carnithine racemase